MSAELSVAALDRVRQDAAAFTAAGTPAQAASRSRGAALYYMAIGTFAVGTEGFMIAAILPHIAGDLKVSVQAAGQLMAIFALTYAVSSPVLTTVFGNFDRRKLLILSMAGFAAANVFAALSTSYWHLAAARVLLALAAGTYVPNAAALAGVLVPEHHRGRALAIVSGGTSLAVALGVPLGAVVGSQFGWRMTFVGVAVLASLAVTGLVFGLPRNIGASLSAVSLKSRLSVARQPATLAALVVTTLWAGGNYVAYTYIAPYLGTVVHLQDRRIGPVLFLWGLTAFLGLQLGGWATDRFGSNKVAIVALPAVALALASLSLIAHTLSPAAALVPVLMAVAVWGVLGWGFMPAQQARLIGIAGVKGASVALSLNYSFMYLGFSLGATIGAVVMGSGGVADLGWSGSLGEVAAIALLLAGWRKRA